MPDFGFVAVCIRPDCEWFAVDATGEPIVSTQLGALMLADAHCHEAHGEPRRSSARSAPADRSPTTAAA
jgi:hypothetical protein